MYRHKSGALKPKERTEKESKTLAQQRSLLSLGFTSQPPNGRSCTADQKPTEDQNCVQNTSDCDNPLIDDSTFTAFTESDTGATAVLDLPLAVDIIRESFTITDSIAVEDNDIGHLADFLTTEQAKVAVRRGPDKHPYQFLCDHSGHSFPLLVLRAKLQNGETTPRDWLVWSKFEQSLYCFPCRLFSKLPQAS